MEEKFIITGIYRSVMVGKNEYPAKSTVFNCELEYNELIFNFSGHATVYFNDQVLETRANTVRFLPMGKPRRYEVLRHEHGECILVGFKTDRPISESAFVKDIKNSEKIGTLFKKLFSVWVSKNEGYYFEALSLLYKIFAEMQTDSHTPQSHYSKIKPAVDKIHEQFIKNELNVGELAAYVGMKESYFQRLFREKYGMPPKRYIIQLKVNHACELLRLGGYSVTEVAELSGFSCVYFFSRQFKEYMGITPTEFIKKYRSSK